jgi:hypothetical protein
MTDTSFSTPTISPRQPWRHPLLWGILCFWGLGVAALANAGILRPPFDGGVPFPLLVSALVPPGLYLIASRTMPGLRDWVARIDMGSVVGIQTFRVIGIVFLFVWAFGKLPTVFAFVAGLGDIAVGVIALGVTLAVAGGAGNANAQVRRLTIAGLLDFVAAFGTAILSGVGMPLRLAGDPLPQAMQGLPMAMIPGFLVPVFIIVHLMAWQKLQAEC